MFGDRTLKVKMGSQEEEKEGRRQSGGGEKGRKQHHTEEDFVNHRGRWFSTNQGERPPTEASPLGTPNEPAPWMHRP